MKHKVYVLYGNPVAWARPAPARNHMWDTQKQLKFQYGINLKQQHDDEPLLDGPLHLEIKFYFHIPRTSHKKVRQLPGDYHIFTPDLSNLIKLIEDVGSGILYKDDALIASMRAAKLYDETPRIEFSLYTLTQED